eukprot:3850611-Lingulodinium_polyedra.AAC.1
MSQAHPPGAAGGNEGTRKTASAMRAGMPANTFARTTLPRLVVLTRPPALWLFGLPRRALP